MIIAVADQCGTCGKAIGETLALLRARSVRKVLVIAADPPHQQSCWCPTKTGAWTCRHRA